MPNKLTEEEVKARIYSYYGNTYCLSKFKYINNSTPFILICKKHGEFKKRIDRLKEGGCLKCIKEEKDTKIKLTELYEIYGDIINSVNFRYKGFHNKASISCISCKSTTQISYYSLLNGADLLCPKCLSKRKIHNEYQTAQRKIIKRYDSNLYDFKFKNNNQEMVEIYCKKHNKFSNRKLLTLLTKKRAPCDFCKKEAELIRNMNRFKEYMENNHPNIIFNSSEYKGVKSPIRLELDEIIVYKTPYQIKASKDLYDCFKPLMERKYIRYTKETFIKRAIKTHKDKYNYTYVKYVNSSTKVKIICPKHGDFQQTPNSHLSGKGCPICGEIRSRKRYLPEPTLLYYIRYKGLYKIGITTTSIKNRYMGELEDKEDFKLIYSWKFPKGEEAYKKERYIKNRYSKFLYKGESVFNKTGSTEVFTKDVLSLDFNRKSM